VKITKRQLRRIIKEEKTKLNEAAGFNERKTQVSSVYDGFVDFLESEGKFTMGRIPKSVLDAIMKAALITVDAMEAESDTTASRSAVGAYSSRTDGLPRERR